MDFCNSPSDHLAVIRQLRPDAANPDTGEERRERDDRRRSMRLRPGAYEHDHRVTDHQASSTAVVGQEDQRAETSRETQVHEGLDGLEPDRGTESRADHVCEWSRSSSCRADNARAAMTFRRVSQ